MTKTKHAHRARLGPLFVNSKPWQTTIFRLAVWTAENSRLVFPGNLGIMPTSRDSCAPNRTAENAPPLQLLAVARPLWLVFGLTDDQPITHESGVRPARC